MYPARPLSHAGVRLNIVQALTRDPYIGHFAFTVSVLSGRTYPARRFRAGASRRLGRERCGRPGKQGACGPREPGRVPPNLRSAVPVQLAGPAPTMPWLSASASTTIGRASIIRAWGP